MRTNTTAAFGAADEWHGIQAHRCCSSRWLAGRTRFEICEEREKINRAARFDVLPSAIQMPVPEPELR
jgi:hypothetical protein